MNPDSQYHALAERLILACLTGHEDAFHIVAAEIGDCGHCWREVAEYAAASAAANRIGELGDIDAAIGCTQDCIATVLDRLAEETEA